MIIKDKFRSPRDECEQHYHENPLVWKAIKDREVKRKLQEQDRINLSQKSTRRGTH